MLFVPVVLEGDHVRLEPLDEKHREGLCEAILDGELWKIPVTFVPHPDELDDFLAEAHEMQAGGEGLAFATVDKESDRVAGSTRFMFADLPHKRTEIGFTFLAKSFQRTALNTEAKLLMLQHAFEVMELNRVELITDHFNFASQKAIRRIGAKHEGILRNHMVMRDGRIRDSIVFSIIRSEWPGVKSHLQGLLTDRN